MRIARLSFAAALLCSLSAQDMPPKMRVSTWVREDIFAGYMDNDMDRHAKGVAKLERVLAANPNAADAIAWQGGNALFAAVRAYESGDMAGFDAKYRECLDLLSRANAIGEKMPVYRQSLLAITGGAFTVFSDRLPEKVKADGWRLVRQSYTDLREAQKAVFPKYPAHFRGEVMAGLAQAAYRLGEPELGSQLTKEVVEALPGTPYAIFAQTWIQKPEQIAKSKITCLSCHDPGRLPKSN